MLRRLHAPGRGSNISVPLLCGKVVGDPGTPTFSVPHIADMRGFRHRSVRQGDILEVQDSDRRSGEALDLVADSLRVIGDEYDNPGPVRRGDLLEARVEPHLLVGVGRLARGVQYLIDLRILVMPVRRVPGPGAVIPLVE